MLDFGLAKVIENANVEAKDVYTMSGETGSLRYSKCIPRLLFSFTIVLLMRSF